MQRTRYSNSDKRILQDHSEEKPGGDVKSINGLNILSNNQVSLVTQSMLSVLSGSLVWVGEPCLVKCNIDFACDVRITNMSFTTCMHGDFFSGFKFILDLPMSEYRAVRGK